MNECILVKWIWKLVNKEESMWSRLLEKKYLKGKDFFSYMGQGGSQFWRGLQKVKHLLKWGAAHKVGNSKATKFWTDVWLDDTLLRLAIVSSL
jgi:hypothetical protein